MLPGTICDKTSPRSMIDLDWSFIKNSAIIGNPLKGNDPALMDAKTFYGAFANTLIKEQAAREFERTATHDSRNVLRDCMGSEGKIDLDVRHAPLRLIGGEEDQIIPAHLNEKNFKAYSDKVRCASAGSASASAKSADPVRRITGRPPVAPSPSAPPPA